MWNETEQLIKRARERFAERDAWLKQGLGSEDRYPEFCGAFGELLSMLIESVERDAATADGPVEA